MAVPLLERWCHSGRAVSTRGETTQRAKIRSRSSSGKASIVECDMVDRENERMVLVWRV